MLIFRTKFAQKGYFRLNREKVNFKTELRRFELVQVPNFTLKKKQNFGPKFAQKGYFRSKTEKGKITVGCCLFNLNQVPNFNCNFIFLGQICPSQVFHAENGKNEHHHFILHIRISLDAKFQLTLANLIFWTKCVQKWIFGSKMERVDSTIKFCILELF